MTDAPAAAPPADNEPDEAESYIDFRKAGGIHLVIDGHKRRLRAPRMRDYRKLVQLWRDEAEALEERTHELQEFLSRVNVLSQERMARGEPALTDEERDQDREYGREIQQLTEAAALRWWVETIRTLGVTPSDCELDPDEPSDDLAVFLTTVDSVNDTLGHWRSVPSRSGAR